MFRAAAIILALTCSSCTIAVDLSHGLIFCRVLEAEKVKSVSVSYPDGSRFHINGVESDVSIQAGGILQGITAGVVKGLGL